MRIGIKILFSLVFPLTAFSQVTGVYKINGLLSRIRNPDTVFVVNFWATWCKPCIQELPVFDSLVSRQGNIPLKVLLVSLDFKENLQNSVQPFLKKNNIKTECILLDEVNGNDFVDLISKKWSGAIPATLVKKGTTSLLAEKKLKLGDLDALLLEVMKDK